MLISVSSLIGLLRLETYVLGMICSIWIWSEGSRMAAYWYGWIAAKAMLVPEVQPPPFRQQHTLVP